ncbi:hypothetical protein WA158_001880 [Blastocystis sp. Blastoise]
MMLSRSKCDPVVYVLGLGITCSDGLKGSSMLFVSYGGCGVACYANCEGSSVALNDANGSVYVDIGSSYGIEGSSVVVHVNSGVDEDICTVPMVLKVLLLLCVWLLKVLIIKVLLF